MRTPQISQNEIITLGIEAMNAGDEAMVQICARALNRDEQAIAECERIIQIARAQE